MIKDLFTQIETRDKRGIELGWQGQCGYFIIVSWENITRDAFEKRISRAFFVVKKWKIFKNSTYSVGIPLSHSVKLILKMVRCMWGGVKNSYGRL